MSVGFFEKLIFHDPNPCETKDFADWRDYKKTKDFFFVTGREWLVKAPQRNYGGQVNIPTGRSGHAQSGRSGGRHRHSRAQNSTDTQIVGGFRAFRRLLRPE
jgi:hypothetical protein